MIPYQDNWALYRGNSDGKQYNFFSDAAQKTPADLTGVIAKSEIRTAPGGTLVTSFDCTLTLPNIINVAISATNSALLTPLTGGNDGAWDLQLTYPDGGVHTPVAGTVAVTMNVTDSAATTRSPQQRYLMRRSGVVTLQMPMRLAA